MLNQLAVVMWTAAEIYIARANPHFQLPSSPWQKSLSNNNPQPLSIQPQQHYQQRSMHINHLLNPPPVTLPSLQSLVPEQLFQLDLVASRNSSSSMAPFPGSTDPVAAMRNLRQFENVENGWTATPYNPRFSCKSSRPHPHPAHVIQARHVLI